MESFLGIHCFSRDPQHPSGTTIQNDKKKVPKKKFQKKKGGTWESNPGPLAP